MSARQPNIIKFLNKLQDNNENANILCTLINNTKDIDDMVIILRELNNFPNILEKRITHQCICRKGLYDIVDKINLNSELFLFFNYLDLKIISDMIYSLLEKLKKNSLQLDSILFYNNNILYLLNIIIEKNIGIFKFDLIKNQEDIFLLKCIIESSDNHKSINEYLFNHYFAFNDFKDDFLNLCQYKEIKKMYSFKNLFKRFMIKRKDKR